MPSPFPGMDPYLEGSLWQDVHQALAYQFRRQLAPLVEPNYAVRLAVSVFNDRVPAHEVGVMYPDVEVLRTPAPRMIRETAAIAIAEAPLTVPLSMMTEVRQVSVEIRDTERNQLITSIEILSPSNKREPGLSSYLNKRDELRLANVHLLEIDLLRRGMRAWPEDRTGTAPYLAALIRARQIVASIWPIGLRAPLPVLPVPLRAPDADVPLKLQEALQTVYDEARYALTLNYTAPPPEPPLSADDTDWAAAQIAAWQSQAP